MIKQQLTPERLNKVYFSLQKLAIMSNVLLLENQTYCDTDFRVPFINQFSKRIATDCKTIQQHIAKSGRMTVNTRNNDNLEEYSAEIWRVVDRLSGLDVEIIREFANHLDKELIDIE